jgi:hypothetical protein
MPVEMKEVEDGRILDIEVTGKITADDYEQFVPEFERQVQRHGKVSVLLKMEQFEGWTAGALWEDIKFDAKHFKDIDRIAMVGDKRWEEGMADFCRPFTTAAIKYFDLSELDAAKAWVMGARVAEAGRPESMTPPA